MIIIDNIIVSEAFIQALFVCDLPQCKGDCCVLGDAGAPLEDEEVSLLEDNLDTIKPFMTEAGRQLVEQAGFFDYDENGKLVTPLINDRECAFTGFHDSGLSYCTIEKAYEAGKSQFQKPVSCHLYPVRLVEKDGFIHLNYHQWSICLPAIRKGNKAGVPLYRFLKDALIRRFGKDWYDRLLAEIKKKY